MKSERGEDVDEVLVGEFVIQTGWTVDGASRQSACVAHDGAAVQGTAAATQGRVSPVFTLAELLRAAGPSADGICRIAGCERPATEDVALVLLHGSRLQAPISEHCLTAAALQTQARSN